jgi:hypothetical protein
MGEKMRKRAEKKTAGNLQLFPVSSPDLLKTLRSIGAISKEQLSLLVDAANREIMGLPAGKGA